MAAERHAVERAAQALAAGAAAAEEPPALLAGGDPLKLVAPHVDDIDHSGLVQVAVLLLQRFHGTVGGKVAALAPLAAAAERQALPTLMRLEACIALHQTFQNAFSLTPLLNRMVALAAQCCALAVRDVSSGATGVVLPLTLTLSMLSEVLSEAVIERVERFRPLDSARLYSAHQAFAEHQGEAARALLAAGDALSSGGVMRPLAPPPERPSHMWRSDELRKFWEAKCETRYDGPAPIDALAVLLLRAAGAETTLQHTEAVMRRLTDLERRDSGRVTAPELDRCASEVRRCGGLRAWVHAMLLPGGAAVSRLGPLATKQLGASGPSGASTVASTSGGGWAATRSFGATCRSSSLGVSTTPTSARSTGRGAFSSTTPRYERRRPFVLTPKSTISILSRRAAAAEDGSGAPLCDAVSQGLLKASQKIVLGDKAAVDSRNGTFRDTPLHSAAAQDRRHAPISTLLLDRGADADAEDRHLATPLHIAASVGHGEAARKLIKCGASVCKEDRWGATPLHRAAANGQADMAEFLLSCGASIDAADEWGSTPLHRAAAKGQLAAAERLLGATAPAAGSGGAADANAEDSCGERPLHLAAKNGDYALVKLLLEHGGDAAARTRLAGKTPEECARERGHGDVVTLLQHRDDWVNVRSQAVVAAA